MNDTQLKRSIQSVGMKCFVKYFEHFSDFTISNEELVDFLMKNEAWVESGCKTRVTQARCIISQGMTRKVLEIVVVSRNIPDDVIHQAESLLISNNFVERRG